VLCSIFVLRLQYESRANEVQFLKIDVRRGVGVLREQPDFIAVAVRRCIMEIEPDWLDRDGNFIPCTGMKSTRLHGAI
jgi:hypothetical protein